MPTDIGLTIGELATRTGCTPGATRYYEREGVSQSLRDEAQVDIGLTSVPMSSASPSSIAPETSDSVWQKGAN